MSNAAQPLNEAYELIEKGDLEAARNLLDSIQADFEDDPDYWWVYAHAVEDAEAGRQALGRVRNVSPDYPGLDALVAESEKDPTTQVRSLRSASPVPPPPPPGMLAETRPNIPADDFDREFDDFDLDEESANTEPQSEGNNRQLLIAVGGLAFLVFIIAGIILLPRLVGGGGTPTEIAANNTANPTVTDASDALAQDATEDMTEPSELPDATTEVEDADETSTVVESTSPPNADATAEVDSTDDNADAMNDTNEPDSTDSAGLSTVSLDDDATALSGQVVTDEDETEEAGLVTQDAVSIGQATETTDDDTSENVTDDTATEAVDVGMGGGAESPTEEASEEISPMETEASAETEVADDGADAGSDVEDDTTEESDASQSADEDNITPEETEVADAQVDDNEADVDEPMATEELLDTATSEATDSDTPTETDVVSDSDDMSTMPDATPTTDFEQLILDLEAFGVPEDGILTEETILGDSLIFTTCSIPGPGASLAITGIIDVLAEQPDSIGGEIDGVGFNVTDCETDELLRQVGIPVSILRAYSVGNITRNDLQRLLRPIG